MELIRDLKKGSTRIQSSIPIPSKVFFVSVPFFLVGHYQLLQFFGQDFRRDHLLFSVSTGALFLLYFSFFCLIIHSMQKLLATKIFNRMVPLFWGMYLLGSSFFLIESWTQRRLNLSLNEALFLLPESFFSKGILYKQLQVEILSWALVICFGGGFGFWFMRKRLNQKRDATHEILIPQGLVVVLLFLSGGILWFEPTLYQAFASDHAFVSLSRTPFHRRSPRSAIRKWRNIVLSTGIDKAAEIKLLRESVEMKSSPKPNIYLILIDSLRVGSLSPRIAPNLLKHIEARTSYESFAPGNCTHVSWYSLFSGGQPYFWKNYMIHPGDGGTLPIRMLRNMGYKIHLITSQSLEPFGKKNKIFGFKKEDLTTYIGPDELQRGRESQWSLSDHSVKSLIDLRKQPGHESGNVYVLSFFATHWPYALGENFEPRALPFMEKVTLEKTLSPLANQHLLLKNRYLNSLAFIDHSLSNFFDSIKADHEWDKSFIFVFGDHGEAFEPGKPMTHCSGLGKDEIGTPLLVKAPEMASKKLVDSKKVPLVATLDVFPTVFDFLGMSEESVSLFSGSSLSEAELKDRKKFVVSINGGRVSDWEIKIFDGELSGIFELENPKALGRELRVKEARLVKVEKVGQGEGIEKPEEIEKIAKYFNELVNQSSRKVFIGG